MSEDFHGIKIEMTEDDFLALHENQQKGYMFKALIGVAKEVRHIKAHGCNVKNEHKAVLKKIENKKFKEKIMIMATAAATAFLTMIGKGFISK